MTVPLQRASRGSTRRLAPWSIAALLAIAMVALLAACGSSNSSNSSSSSSPSSASPATTTVAGIPITVDPALKAMLPAGTTSVRVAADIPYPPWEYYVSPTSKQATGFDYDLSQAIGAVVGVPVSFNEQPFSSIILSIKANKNQVAMSDMYDNAVREKVLSFVDYAKDTTSIIVLKGNPKGITDLNSLAGKTVAVETGTTQQVFLQTLNKQFAGSGKAKMNILTLPDQPSALLAIKSGRAVGDLTDHSTAGYIARTTQNGNAFQLAADPASPNGYAAQLVGAGILKSNTALITVWQKALQDLIDSGAYAKIVAKYGLVPVTSAQIDQGTAPVTSPSP
jgi:polar amino acid transport system substrate-binding protein